MSGFDLRLAFDPEDVDTAEVLVDGTVCGRDYRFLLDTGCARTTLRYDPFTARFPKLASEDSSGVFGSASYDLVTVPEIALGPISATDVMLSRMREGGPDRNLFGMDLLKRHCLRFAFDEARVDVVIPGEGTISSGEPLDSDRGSIPRIGVQCGATAKAVWDSGASITLADLTFIESNSEMFEAVGSSLGKDSTERRRETPMFSMKGFRCGGHEFPAHRIAGVDLSFLDSHGDGPVGFILGFTTLSKANWILDFAGGRWAMSAGTGSGLPFRKRP